MKCRNCKQTFKRVRPLQIACSLECALALKLPQAKATKAERDKIKPRSQWLKEAQAAVNKYVRLRDAHLGCVSCDKGPEWGGQWHASHLRSVGAASAVRFNLWNIHKACSVCNNYLSGNLAEYEPRLRERIGDSRVDWLKRQNQRAVYTVEYLSRIKAIFLKKAKRSGNRTVADV